MFGKKSMTFLSSTTNEGKKFEFGLKKKIIWALEKASIHQTDWLDLELYLIRMAQ